VRRSPRRYHCRVPTAAYWGSLFGLTLIGGAARVVRGGPLLRGRVHRLGRLELAATVVAILALGFHCAAMFLPAVVSSLPGSIGAARAVRDLGLVSQIAYWVPAALLLTALRRAWPPLLVIESGALLAVGVTMFSSFGLPAHLVAIAGSVAVTVAVLTTLGESPAGRTNGAERSV